MTAATGGTEVLDAEKIGQDCHCLLGKWLHGEGKETFGQLPAYRDCVQKHALFHVKAGEVARVINGGDYEKAKKMLDRNTPYANVSLEVVMAIGKMKREAKL